MIQTITSVANGAEILANPRKLSCWHSNNGLIFSIRDAEMLAINIHQLHLEVSDLILR